MKKTITLLMFLVLIVSVSASCTVSETEPNNDFSEAQVIDKSDCFALGININGSNPYSDPLDVFKIEGPFYKGDKIKIWYKTEGRRKIALFNKDEEIFTPIVRFMERTADTFSMKEDSEFIYVGIYDYLALSTNDYGIKINRIHGAIEPLMPQRILLDFDGDENVTISQKARGHFGEVLPLEDSWLAEEFPGQIDEIKNFIKDMVIEDYKGFDVKIYTTDNPILPQKPYSTVYFGGNTYHDLWGLAETDNFNSDLEQEAIVIINNFRDFYDYYHEREYFNFRVIDMSQALANTASHEMGHMLGLTHTNDPIGMMGTGGYYSDSISNQHFLNSPLDEWRFPIGRQNAPKLLSLALGTWECFDSDLTPVDHDPSHSSYSYKGYVEYKLNGEIKYIIDDRCQSTNESGLDEAFCTNSGWAIRTLNCPTGQICNNDKCELLPENCIGECRPLDPNLSSGCMGEIAKWVCDEVNDGDSCPDRKYEFCPSGTQCERVSNNTRNGHKVNRDYTGFECVDSEWSVSAATAGEPVSLMLGECIDCNSGEVNFEVFNSFGNSQQTFSPVFFNEQGIASTNWTTNAPGELGANPQFYFESSLYDYPENKITSELLTIQTTVCGNGIVERGEQCDCGENGCSELELNEQSCSSLGFEGGNLGCYSDCKAFDLSNCVGACAPIRASFKPEEEVWPDIFGNLIVWESKRKNPSIYYYDISTGIEKRVVGENSKSYRRPSIYGDNVALERYDPITDLSRLWVLSPISGFLDTTGTEMSTRERFVDIFEDRVTYLAKTGEGNDVFVYQIYDVLTHTRYEPIQITTTAHLSDDFPPKIFGNKIVWFDEVDAAIYIYNIVEGSEPTELVSSVNAVSSSPLIFEDNVVWNEFKDSEWKVFTKNISTGFQTQIGTGTKFLSDFDEDLIIWSEWRKETGYGTYMFDTSTGTETHLLTNSSENPHVRVHEKTMVWEDNGDIYYCKIPTCGNNIVEPGEQCDGNQPEPGEPWPCSVLGENWQGGNHVLCDSSCHFIDAVDRCGLCGNGQLESNEICDDGDTDNCDGCNADCSREDDVCGDDIKECSEVCERGDSKACRIGSIVGTKKCNSSCTGWNSCKTIQTCFLKDTEILTPVGNKKIQDLKVGDMVMSFNEQTGKKEPTKVIETFTHETDSYLIINGKLKVTPNHPLQVNGKWVQIGNAKIGDKLKTVNGEETINSIEVVSEKVEVYNIEVEKNHNYYAEDYLTHNKVGGTEI